MRALTTIPLTASSLEVSDVPDPSPHDGDLLVDGIAVGVCGTDKEISRGEYGWAPPGRERLVLGHESLGRVREAPEDADFAAGDLVVGVVRRPDPVPCGACAHGEFDMCRNGQYTERGIKQIDGYASEQWTVEAAYAVKLDDRLADVGMLMEPTSVVAKAWEQAERIGRRAWFEPKSVLVTGAGPIGLLAALLGTQRGLDVHVLDRVTDGPKPELVRQLGATYHSGDLAACGESWDIVVECTGAAAVFFAAIRAAAPDGIVCLTGVSSGSHLVKVNAATLNRELVLENNVIFGTVNANRRHYEQAAASLAAAQRAWLERLITRRVPIEQFAEAFEGRPGDVKTILTF